MRLESNPILYAGMLQVINRGTAEILENTQEGIFLMDTVSKGYFLAADDACTGIRMLKKYEHYKYQLLSVFQEEIGAFATERYGFSENLTCFQAVYQLKTLPKARTMLQIKAATEKDLPLIMEHYKTLEEWELKEIVQRGDLYLGYCKEAPVGFVGKHLEGSMGLLQVFPQYRRKGYGGELEKFMISRMIEEKLIPFCQVEVGNEKSFALQRKLNLTFSKEKVYWLFR